MHMPKFSFLLVVLFTIFSGRATAQDTLPNITVKNLGGQIVVSWVNNYKAPVTTINIQRSYDSLKNYTTIGSVLNPQNIENGYAYATPPYNKMYYRVFISFEGGTYLFSKVARPVKEKPATPVVEDTLHPFLVKDNWAAQGTVINNKPKTIGIQPKPLLPAVDPNTEIITYPSRRIYSAKDNNIVIVLPDAQNKKYLVKFFDENDNFLFELNKITEPYLIVERVNFIHAGWFHFEVYENGKLIEKNKFQVAKEGKY
jgi:hypothetical protein